MRGHATNGVCTRICEMGPTPTHCGEWISLNGYSTFHRVVLQNTTRVQHSPSLYYPFHLQIVQRKCMCRKSVKWKFGRVLSARLDKQCLRHNIWRHFDLVTSKWQWKTLSLNTYFFFKNKVSRKKIAHTTCIKPCDYCRIDINTKEEFRTSS